MAQNQPLIEVRDLVVDYGRKKKTRALHGVTFAVEPGETVGFIGANGAGKSTAIKTVMGFVFPTTGEAKLFGYPPSDSRSRLRVGYLPEVALYYPFMKARELLELYGGLSGMNRADLKSRIPNLLERVGLGGKGESLLRQFSKGMQQRLGIAQSMIADPDLLIFDELSSGLDPLGRHDLRDVLLELKSRGRTIFFSSHELSEVESLCDRVIIIHKGRIVKQARVADLMEPLNQYVIDFRLNGSAMPDAVAAENPQLENGIHTLNLRELDLYTKLLGALSDSGCEVIRTSSKTRSLEAYYTELVRGEDAA